MACWGRGLTEAMVCFRLLLLGDVCEFLLRLGLVGLWLHAAAAEQRFHAVLGMNGACEGQIGGAVAGGWAIALRGKCWRPMSFSLLGMARCMRTSLQA